MNYLSKIDFPEFDSLLATAQSNLTHDSETLLLDDDDKKNAKDKRADLNKTIKDFKADAKQVRDAVVGTFDTKVKQIVAVLDENQLLLKDKVEAYDEKWKVERRAFIETAINSHLTEALPFVQQGHLYDPRFMNTTFKEKEIITQLDDHIATIQSDYQIAQAVSAQVAEIFKQTLSVPQAIELDKQQQEEQARREAVAKAEKERQERERQEQLARQKERERQAMVEAEIAEAKENGEVLDAEKMMEIHSHADEYAEKEATKTAIFTVKFEYKDSNYAMAWESPLEDIKYRLEGLSNVEIVEAE